ncbi:MAG: translation initiation factor IF-3 [Patescibacteria group bacterium]|nr:translation initiation factor IF-3 [Patescibacteria group bacterium]MDE2438236.1 translation initiation factor IF-3 [Patescibacteria group bacterium]
MITAETLRVVTDKGENLGVLSRTDALKKARENGMDLVEIAPLAKPPVAKIINFDKYRYEKEKQLKKTKASLEAGDLKVVRITFGAAAHDLETKATQIKKFLGKGHKVQIILRLRGREMRFKDLAKQKLQEFLGLIAHPYKITQDIKPAPKSFIVQIQ